MPTDESDDAEQEHESPPVKPPSDVYIWTPLQRKRLVALRERFWVDPAFSEDRRAVLVDPRLDFARWQIRCGYYSDYPATPSSE